MKLMAIQVFLSFFFGILVTARFLKGVSQCESYQEPMVDDA